MPRLRWPRRRQASDVVRCSWSFSLVRLVRYRLCRPACCLVVPGWTARLSPPGFTPGGEIGQRLLVRRGIEPENPAAPLDLLGDEILERRHFEGFVRDLVGEVRGEHDHAVA